MNPPLVVLKFGSSVLENRDGLPAVVHEVYRHHRRGQRVLAVVSAIGRHTEVLLGEARHWMDPPAPEGAVAELLATGERQSAALLTMALARAGVSATLLSPSGIKLILRGKRFDAWPVAVDIKAIHDALRSTPVLVVPGFAGMHETGGTALMGRGGSDLTAVFLAHALDAVECRLVKDVNGIYERDPAEAVTAESTASPPHRYREVTYEDALRVSGALVQAKAIEYLREQKISVRVAGLLQEEGTTIGTPATTIHDLPASPPLRVVLLGLGQVGQGVYCHVQRLDAFAEIVGVLVRDPKKSRDFPAPGGLLSTDLGELLRRPHDVVIDVCGDPSTARQAVEIALAAGRPAITASKRLIAEHGPALASLAAKYGTRIRHSAAVGGAAPMIEALERALQDGPIMRLRGVLNGTCNFILDRLAHGVPFHKAVSHARLRGFAESNVSRDLQGDDAADKLRILMRLAFGVETEAVPISRQALLPQDSTQFGPDVLQGQVVRQVATFDPATGASVRLEVLSPDDYLADAAAEESRLIISGADGREWRVSGKGAGRWPSAESVIADLLDVHAWISAKEATETRRSSGISLGRERKATPA